MTGRQRFLTAAVLTFGLACLAAARAADAPWLHPFGIALGRPLPDNLKQHHSEFYPSDAAFAVIYKEVTPPAVPKLDPAPEKPVVHPYGYRVFTTPGSGTVYRVDAELPYKDHGACKKAAESFARGMIAGAGSFEGGSWQRGELNYKFFRKSDDMEVVTGVAGGKKTGAFDPKRPLVLSDVAGLAGARGTRFVMGCGDRRLFITVQHLPSLELRIAEAYQGNKTLSKLFAPDQAGQTVPAYFTPFGVRLGKPLPKAIRTVRAPQSDHPLSQTAYYRIAPPNPHGLFRSYEAGVTAMTQSVTSLTAALAVKSRNECRESLDKVAKKMAETYGVAAPKWYRPANSDALVHARLSPDQDKRQGLFVSIEFKCDSIEDGHTVHLVAGTPGYDKEHRWVGSVHFALYGQEVYPDGIVFDLDDLERGLMNPTKDQ